MGWWPFSASGADAAARPYTISTTASPVQKPSDAPTPSGQQSPAQEPPHSAPHDPDFYAAHPHLAPPSFSSNTAPSLTGRTDDAPQPSSPSEEYDPTLPRTMSCRAAFDSAFYCSSLGGHFNDIYRYGQLRSCSDHWNDFWFCMRTKNSYSGQDVKERMVQDRYREKEQRLKSGPNSEHVWTKRGVGEEVKGAFSRPAEEVVGQ
ncbi:Early meiotic induction protein 1 [Stemphylium lycopersici]|uniref:Early meiotic induction protein 1 n=1 Tax=Stemphylium lycopersici TaxID=183478 RepID=A0A364NH33_STELY|nr:Early meiotic induction protein 1 [Stemphylium lycopersici]